MKRVFLSVGTSLFAQDLLGPPSAFRPLRERSVLAAWDEAAESQEPKELVCGEAEARLSAALAAARELACDGIPDLATVVNDFPQRIRLLRDAFVLGGDEAEAKMLSAELASLCRLLELYPLKRDDGVVILATDSPEGHLAGTVLAQVLQEHPVLAGADVELVSPRHWQPHDGLRLAERGASNLLAVVSRRIAADLRARSLFVLTGGLKLGITVLSQVSCWSQAAHDGLFLKLEDPGGVFFPPCSFVESPGGHILLPHHPTAELRAEMPFTDDLWKLVEAMEPPVGGGGPAPITTLVVTVGVGLVRASPEILAARFGSSRLAEKATWDAIDQHALCRSWEELRREMADAPGDHELAGAVEGVMTQLRGAWDEGRPHELSAELAVLRSLWAGAKPEPTPLLRGSLRVVLLATDSLTGEYCASLAAQFLEKVAGITSVETEIISGFHPYGGLPAKRPSSDSFTKITESLAAVAAQCERLLMVPLGGIKLHLPLLTVLATRLRSPLVLGHLGLERPVVVPWLESDEKRVRGAVSLTETWPELADLPTVRLEVDDG